MLLINEIDKAGVDVPNALLEVLGNRSFPVPPLKLVVKAERLPLIVITTNEERTLPDAFVRRCLVIRLDVPTDESGLIAFLMRRGEAHFPQAEEKVLRKAAEMLLKDRQAAIAAFALGRMTVRGVRDVELAQAAELEARRDRIRTLRQPGGLSGFTKRSESEYDPFGAAHSSTSISAALVSRWPTRCRTCRARRLP